MGLTRLHRPPRGRNLAGSLPATRRRPGHDHSPEVLELGVLKMAEASFDCFQGSFADRPDRGVRFLVSSQLLGPLLASEMVQRVARVARLPYLDGPVSLYADASPKPFGFPA